MSSAEWLCALQLLIHLRRTSASGALHITCSPVFGFDSRNENGSGFFNEGIVTSVSPGIRGKVSFKLRFCAASKSASKRLFSLYVNAQRIETAMVRWGTQNEKMSGLGKRYEKECRLENKLYRTKSRQWSAFAFARRVFPVPGGPYSNIPPMELIP